MRKSTTARATKALTAVTASYGGWEFEIGAGDSEGGLLFLDLKPGGATATTLTLKFLDVEGGGPGGAGQDYERLDADASGAAVLDTLTITISGLTTKTHEAVDYKQFSRYVELPAALACKVQAVVNDAADTPTLGARWYPDQKRA